MNFEEMPEFIKDFKKLGKKYRSLPEDMKQFRKIVLKFPLGSKKHFNVLKSLDGLSIVKARLSCQYLKGSSLRIVYAYCETKGKIEFIEIYSKSDKQREDRKRLRSYISQCSRLSATG